MAIWGMVYGIAIPTLARDLARRAMHEGIDCQQRKKARCFVLVRHPVERFLSYYQERTAGTLGLASAWWVFAQKYKVYNRIDTCTLS